VFRSRGNGPVWSAVRKYVWWRPGRRAGAFIVCLSDQNELVLPALFWSHFGFALVTCTYVNCRHYFIKLVVTRRRSIERIPPPLTLTFHFDVPKFNHLVPCGQGYDWWSLVTIGLELVPGSCSQLLSSVSGLHGWASKDAMFDVFKVVFLL